VPPVRKCPSVRDDTGRTLNPGVVGGLLAGMALMFATGLLVSV
jgi:ZIP family zinc transporter